MYTRIIILNKWPLLPTADKVHALYDYTIFSRVQTKYHLETTQKCALYQQVTNAHRT